MSLKPLQATLPLGQFDGYDSDYLTLKGGEVCTFISVPTLSQPGVSVAGYDKAAYDVFDGYVDPASVQKRPVVCHTFLTAASGFVSGNAYGSSRPLMLADEGITGYGTLFGSVVGGIAGQQVNGPNTFTGAVLGPHTATASGKVTCWSQDGLYAVSLDAVDANATTGLQPTNTTIDVGQALTFSTTGLLTPVGSAAAMSTAPTVARLVEFSTNGSLVTTPNTLVAALNSPSGNVSSAGPRQLTFATIWFAGATL